MSAGRKREQKISEIHLATDETQELGRAKAATERELKFPRLHSDAAVDNFQQWYHCQNCASRVPSQNSFQPATAVQPWIWFSEPIRATRFYFGGTAHRHWDHRRFVRADFARLCQCESQRPGRRLPQ